MLGFASHYYNFLPALLAQLIPNTTAPHPITYTNEDYTVKLQIIITKILHMRTSVLRPTYSIVAIAIFRIDKQTCLYNLGTT